MKKLLLVAIGVFIMVVTQSQTLFTYGTHTVSKQEFLRAFNKNSNIQTATEADYRTYLDLYIRFKLKVAEALEKKMDTLPTQEAELKTFRDQIVEGFLNDSSSLQVLIDEAFERSQKDIHLSYIFIPDSVKAPVDTTEAFKQAADIGYITVFTLPYDLETTAYNTKPGNISKAYHGKSGYYIFKNLGERPAAGRMRVAQILLTIPPDADDKEKEEIKHKADSLYLLLQKGAKFEALAEKFSQDNLTFQTGGEMPEFGVGTYDPSFENAVLALKKEGEVSKPVLTSQGYHIIKRLAIIPVNKSKDSTIAMASLRQQVLNDLRKITLRSKQTEKIYQFTKLNKQDYDETKLWEYYRNNLEKYNPEFALQLKEFKEGNLLFEIMQAEIWEKASEDAPGLQNYYTANKSTYIWEPSADVIIFNCNDEATATAMRTAFSINTHSWRDIAKTYEDRAQIDSGRYELSQLPITDTSIIKKGTITQLITNPEGNNITFVYIDKLYPERVPRTFEEAKGYVLSDYQIALEEKWVEALKKKYPVTVDESVFTSLLSQHSR